MASKKHENQGFIHHLENITIDEFKDHIEKIRNVKDGNGFLYWLENFVYVPHVTEGAKPLKDYMYVWQRGFALQVFDSRYFIWKKMRQVGASIMTGCYLLYRCLFFENQNCIIISQSQYDSSELLSKIKQIFKCLPSYMKQKTNFDSKTTMEFASLNSKITSLPNSSGGRGGSVSVLVLDEFAFYDNAKTILSGGIPSLATGALTPFSNETLPSQLFIVSTYPHAPIENEYLRLLNGAREHPDTTRYKVIDVDSSDIPSYKSKDWHAEQLESLGKRIYEVEILGKEPLDSENGFFPDDVLRRYDELDENGNINKDNTVIPPIRCDFLYPKDVDEEGMMEDFGASIHLKDNFDENHNYIKDLWIWKDPIPGFEYCVVCDVAEGGGGDYNALHVISLSELEQVAEYKNNRTHSEQYKEIIKKVSKYYNNAKLSIEKNAVGKGIVDYFVSTLEYPNFYHHRKTKKNYIAGFPMSTGTRPEAIALMGKGLINGDVIIRSMRLVNEFRAFGWKNNKIQALSGHDDLVMALCQFFFIREAGFAISENNIVDEMDEFIKESGLEDSEEVETSKSQQKIDYYIEFFDLDSIQQEKLYNALTVYCPNGIKDSHDSFIMNFIEQNF